MTFLKTNNYDIYKMENRKRNIEYNNNSNI